MFLVNSQRDLFTAASFSSEREVLHLTLALLLPKLRSQFAEFLNQGYLKRLRILSSPTCVGFGYGYPRPSLEVFLGGMGSISYLSPAGLRPRRALGLNEFLDLPGNSPYTLEPGQPSPG